jgi:capsular polysaccharide biosynthesis protein
MRLQHDPELMDAPLLVDVKLKTWQRDLLQRMGVESSRLRTVDFRESMVFRDLIAPSHLSRDMVAHPEAIRFIRNRLAPHADDAVPKAGKWLYLTRSSGAARRSSILNERRVIEKFKKAGFRVVDPASMTVAQQIEIFSDVEVIAGPGGAALANIVFAPRTAKVLALAPASALCETFASVASIIGQEYWWCSGASFARPYPAWIWTTFDCEISMRDIAMCFENLL